MSDQTPCSRAIPPPSRAPVMSLTALPLIADSLICMLNKDGASRAALPKFPHFTSPQQGQHDLHLRFRKF